MTSHSPADRFAAKFVVVATGISVVLLPIALISAAIAWIPSEDNHVGATSTTPFSGVVPSSPLVLVASYPRIFFTVFFLVCCIAAIGTTGLRARKAWGYTCWGVLLLIATIWCAWAALGEILNQGASSRFAADGLMPFGSIARWATIGMAAAFMAVLVWIMRRYVSGEVRAKLITS